ncbi:unnamed protein product [Phaeothamnion confervicola]
MKYLLDTNVLSDLVRNPSGSIAQRIARVGESQVCTSIIVSAELKFGALKKSSAKLSAQVNAILSLLPVLPFIAPADIRYGELRERLERLGIPIGGNDLLIAAQTLALDLTLVTDNVREFSRIQELKLENWLREP